MGSPGPVRSPRAAQPGPSVYARLDSWAAAQPANSCCIPPEVVASLHWVKRGMLIFNYTDMDAHPPAHSSPRERGSDPGGPLGSWPALHVQTDGEAQQGLWLECDTLLLFCSGTSVNFPLPGSLSFPLGLPTASAQNLNLSAGWEVTEGDSSRGLAVPAGRACKRVAEHTPQSSENDRQRTERVRRGYQGWGDRAGGGRESSSLEPRALA